MPRTEEAGGTPEEAPTIPVNLIREFVARSCGSDELLDDENIFATGLVTSLFAIQLIAFLEKTFKISVEVEDLDPENFATVAAITAFATRKTAERQEKR